MGSLHHGCAQDTGSSPSTVIFLKCKRDQGPLDSTLPGPLAAVESEIYLLRMVPSALHCRTLKGVCAFSTHPSSGCAWEGDPPTHT